MQKQCVPGISWTRAGAEVACWQPKSSTPVLCGGRRRTNSPKAVPLMPIPPSPLVKSPLSCGKTAEGRGHDDSEATFATTTSRDRPAVETPADRAQHARHRESVPSNKHQEARSVQRRATESMATTQPGAGLAATPPISPKRGPGQLWPLRYIMQHNLIHRVHRRGGHGGWLHRIVTPRKTFLPAINHSSATTPSCKAPAWSQIRR